MPLCTSDEKLANVRCRGSADPLWAGLRIISVEAMLGPMNERGCAVSVGVLLIAFAVFAAVLIFLGFKVTPQPVTFMDMILFAWVPLVPAMLGWLIISYGRRKDDA